MKVQMRKNKIGQQSNQYFVTTRLIGVFVGLSDFPGGVGISDMEPLPQLTLEALPENPTTEVSAKEVLTKEPISWIGEKVIGKLNEIKSEYSIPGKAQFTKEREKMIKARFFESKLTSLTPIFKMIEHRCKVWKGTEFEKYIRIETLFRASKFVGYMEEAEAQPAKDWTETRTNDSETLNAPLGNISW